MSEVWAVPATRLIIVDGPPVPSSAGNNPYAGLGFDAARRLGAILSASDARLDEAKAIGTASLTANVGQRDNRLRFFPPDKLREAIKQASAGAGAKLNRVYSSSRAALTDLIGAWARGEMSEDQMRLETAKQFRRAYESIRDIARDASGLTSIGGSLEILAEEDKWFRSAVIEELRYWHRFLDGLVEGRIDEGSVPARVDKYVKAMRFMYEAARVQALPDRVLLYWAGPEDEGNCPGCAYMIERSPFPKDNLPCAPQDGTTRCGVHCRHRLVVRVPQLYEDVIRRRRALPNRATMLRELRRMKGGGARAIKTSARGRARNPFKGTKASDRRL